MSCKVEKRRVIAGGAALLLLLTTASFALVWVYAPSTSSSPSPPFQPPTLPPFPAPSFPECPKLEYDVAFNTDQIYYSKGAVLKPLSSLTQEQVVASGYVPHWEPSLTPLLSVDYSSSQTPVKNQGQCGSCWAHAFTEVMEWHFTNIKGKVLELSRMEVLACTQYGNKCEGENAIVDVVLDFAISKQSLIPAELYPYDPRIYFQPPGFKEECLSCRLNISRFDFAKVHSFGPAVPECVSGPCTDQNMTRLAMALDQYGPIMVAVDANEAWQTYKGGILPHTACSSSANAGDHAVVLVGATSEYWLVRNSWGSNWGENGYIRLQRDDSNSTNTCGIANQAIWMQAQYRERIG